MPRIKSKYKSSCRQTCPWSQRAIERWMPTDRTNESPSTYFHDFTKEAWHIITQKKSIIINVQMCLMRRTEQDERVHTTVGTSCLKVAGQVKCSPRGLTLGGLRLHTKSSCTNKSHQQKRSVKAQTILADWRLIKCLLQKRTWGLKRTACMRLV